MRLLGSMLDERRQTWAWLTPSLRSWGSALAVACLAISCLAVSCSPTRPQRVLVKLRSDQALSQAVEATYPTIQFRTFGPPGAAGVDEFAAALAESPLSQWRIATLPQGMTAQQAIAQLAADPNVETVEVDAPVSMDVVPDDARFGELWGLHGPSTGFDADVNAAEAWNIKTSSGLKVAVIDTGVDYTHPDLVANIWTNASEVPGNGLDDDRNGYVDDVHGYDFWANDGDPRDENGHGTHVAGTIGAVGNNGAGVTGVAWSVTLVPVRFLGPQGTGYTADAIEAIVYATKAGARILNASWGSTVYSGALAEAISFASQRGVLVVAAAGNSGLNAEVYPHYPASFGHDNVISVAALDRTGDLAGFSNYGAYSVDVAAPGVDILSTLPGGGYGYLDGTSMAAPHVAGALAVLWSRLDEVGYGNPKQFLLQAVKPLVRDRWRVVSGGTVDLFAAIPATGSPLSLWRESNGTFFHLSSTNTSCPLGMTPAFTLENTLFCSRQWGLPGDKPIDADFDGDGIRDYVVYRPSEGVWHVTTAEIPTLFLSPNQLLNRSNNFLYTSYWRVQWNAGTDAVMSGDLDGDGLDDFVRYAPGTGTWTLLPSSRVCPASMQSIGWWNGFSGFPVCSRQFGLASDEAVLADYDGDEVDDVAVWRPSSGEWILMPSSGVCPPMFQSLGNHHVTPSRPYCTAGGFGLAAYGDRPMPMDTDGDGRVNPTFWRASWSWWVTLVPSSSCPPGFDGLGPLGASLACLQTLGGLGDVGVARHDADGDGRHDPTLWSPATGFWTILPSTGRCAPPLFPAGNTGAHPLCSRQFGLPGYGDVPLP